MRARQRPMLVMLGSIAVSLIFAVAPVFAGDYDVDQGNTTTHVPYQPPGPEPPDVPSHTEMAPTWPVQVPVRVPDSVEGPREQPHAGENEGSHEMGEHMQEQQSEPAAP